MDNESTGSPPDYPEITVAIWPSFECINEGMREICDHWDEMEPFIRRAILGSFEALESRGGEPPDSLASLAVQQLENKWSRLPENTKIALRRRLMELLSR